MRRRKLAAGGALPRHSLTSKLLRLYGFRTAAAAGALALRLLCYRGLFYDGNALSHSNHLLSV